MYIAADCYKYIPTTLRGCSIILLITFHISFFKGAGAFLQFSAHPWRALSTLIPLQLQLDGPYSITCHYPSYIRKSHYCSTPEITSSCEPRCHSLRCSAAISLRQRFPALCGAGETRRSGTAIFHYLSGKQKASCSGWSLHRFTFY